MAQRETKTCNCKKSNCLKLYCDCFAIGAYCNPGKCNCLSCMNNEQFENKRSKVVMQTIERDPFAFRPKVISKEVEKSHKKGCHCKRSNCLKKYCECFQGGISCSEKCKCIECQNTAGVASATPREYGTSSSKPPLKLSETSLRQLQFMTTSNMLVDAAIHLGSQTQRSAIHGSCASDLRDVPSVTDRPSSAPSVFERLGAAQEHMQSAAPAPSRLASFEQLELNTPTETENTSSAGHIANSHPSANVKSSSSSGSIGSGSDSIQPGQSQPQLSQLVKRACESMCRELVKRIRVAATATDSTTQADITGGSTSSSMKRTLVLTNTHGELDTPRNVVIRTFCGSLQAELARLRQSTSSTSAARPKNAPAITATSADYCPGATPLGNITGGTSKVKLADGTSNPNAKCAQSGDHIDEEDSDTRLDIAAVSVGIAEMETAVINHITMPTVEISSSHSFQSLTQLLSVESTMMSVTALLGRPEGPQLDPYAIPYSANATESKANATDTKANANTRNNSAIDSNTFLSQNALIPSGPTVESQDTSPTTSTDSSHSNLNSYYNEAEAHEASDAAVRQTVHKQTDPLLPSLPSALVVTDLSDSTVELLG